jgi:dTDP-4-amino-4,6-dideoxygalactose transaminase
MKVPFLDLDAAHKDLRREIVKSFDKVIRRGDFILGSDVKAFEEEFARFSEAKYALGVSSGTAALFLALVSLNIQQGDEVILPDLTFIATAMAVSYTGAKPVFADIREDTYNIDVAQIEKLITKNTKAIMPVHLFGQPADMPVILDLARKYNLKVIEDAAQAHGAAIRMPGTGLRKVGGLGDIGCFSFYPTKNLGGMGDGGLITTQEERIFNKLKILRDCGRTSKYEHDVIGYNSRLDTMQAAILRIKMKRLEEGNEKRRRNAELYNKYLKDIPEVVIPCVLDGVRHVYHIYAIRVKNRDRVLQHLKDKEIGAVVHYPVSLHMQKAYSGLGYKNGDFPISERIPREIISLPMFPQLKESQIRYVVQVIKEALE